MSECSCEFEPKINIECAMEIISIVRGGDLLGRRADLLKHAGCLLGCLGAKLEDGEEEQVFSTAGELPQELAACCDEVEQSLSNDTYAMNPILMSLLMKLAELALRKILH